jgi:peptidyl-prolyl cis-trans isomerase SurA
MINYFLKILIIFIFFNINFANSTQELDRIVAIVNKNVITYNDLTGGINKALLFFEQNSIEPPEKTLLKKKFWMN